MLLRRVGNSENEIPCCLSLVIIRIFLVNVLYQLQNPLNNIR